MSLLFLGLLAPLCAALRRGKAAPPICDEQLVFGACQQFSSGKTTVTAEALADSLVVSEASAAAFLEELGFGGEASCQELCERAVARFPQEQLPPLSNVGCHMD